MRYPTEHKSETREQILAAAARRFRAEGLASAGVAAIMRDAGLTHGGFYAHFKSKEDLIVEVITQGFDRVTERFEAHFEGLEGDAWLRAWVDAYLGQTHFEHVAEGCPFPPLAGEVARSGPTAIEAFTRLCLERCPSIERHIDAPPAESRRRTLAAISQMVGALMLARATDGPFSTEIREAAADAAFAALTGEAMPKRTPQGTRRDPLANPTAAPSSSEKPRDAQSPSEGGRG